MDYKEIAGALEGMELVDLTFPMEAGMPVWPTHQQFFHNPVETIAQGDDFSHFAVTMGEHSGTHLDAPCHHVGGGKSVDIMDLHKVYGRAVKIEAADIGPLGLVTADYIKTWEKEHTPIAAGDIVLFHFGWDAYWGVKPDNGKFLKDWPGLSKDGAEYLAEKKVKAVGTDALSLDVFATEENPTHKVLLNKEIVIIENVNNLGCMPDTFFFSAWPLKIKDGSGSPIRAVGFYKK